MHLARSQATWLGLPELPVVHIERRLADRSHHELEELVDAALGDIRAAIFCEIEQSPEAGPDDAAARERKDEQN